VLQIKFKFFKLIYKYISRGRLILLGPNPRAVPKLCTAYRILLLRVVLSAANSTYRFSDFVHLPFW